MYGVVVGCPGMPSSFPSHLVTLYFLSLPPFCHISVTYIISIEASMCWNSSDSRVHHLPPPMKRWSLAAALNLIMMAVPRCLVTLLVVAFVISEDTSYLNDLLMSQ